MKKTLWTFLSLLIFFVIISRDDAVNAKEHVSSYDDEHVNNTKHLITIKHKKPKRPDEENGDDDDHDDDDDDLIDTSGEFDDESEKIDVLTEEGNGGWLQKQIEKNEKKNKNKKEGSDDEGTENASERAVGEAAQPPAEAVAKLDSSLSKFGGLANRAKAGMAKMTENWGNKPFPERAFITTALWTASRNIGAFANAKEDPMGAVVGAVNIAASFAAVLGPTGMLVSAGISFIGGILSLFGKGPKRKSVGEIVREQIDEALDKFYDQTLSDEAQGAIEAMRHSKAFLDGVASTGEMISDSEASSLSSHVPVYYGVKFMGKLAAIIRRLVNANNVKDAKKCLKYIELYCTIATIKDMTLQQFATLLPDSHRNIRAGVFAHLGSLRDGQEALFGFLYKAELGNKIMPYFDPDISVISDSYLDKVLKIRNYDRSLAGTYCFTPGRGKQSMTFSTADKKYGKNRPYATLAGGNNCFWKVVPHGNWLFSIVNRKNCPKDRYCGALLSFDGIGGGKARVTIDHEDPVLWEIAGSQQRRIRTKYGCNSSPPGAYCNKELGMGYEVYYRYGFGRKRDAFGMMRPIPVKVLTGQLLKSYGGYVWWLTKNPK